MDAQPRRRSRLLAAAARLTTPLLPEDYLTLFDPLWSTTSLHARVVGRYAETSRATTLVLRPGAGWNGHRAGQYVRIGVDVDGVRHWRTYSLSGAEDDPEPRITVQTLDGGTVSPQLAHRTPIGTVLPIEPATGEFTLPRIGEHAVFVTAGSGLTPVMGMLRTLAHRPGTPLDGITLVHSARDHADTLFATDLRRLVRRGLTVHLRHTGVDGRLGPSDVERLVPDVTERPIAVCGPGELIDAAVERWGGRVHSERFTPPTRSTGGRGGTVRYGDRAVAVDGETSLLDAGETAGLLMPSGCRMGICFSCVLPLRDGQVRDLRTGAVHGDPGDLIQTCVSGATDDCTLDLPR